MEKNSDLIALPKTDIMKICQKKKIEEKSSDLVALHCIDVVGEGEVDGAEVGVGLALAADVVQVLQDRQFLKYFDFKKLNNCGFDC